LEERFKYYKLDEKERLEVVHKIKAVLEEYDVDFAAIFGSFVYGDAFRDVDVAVYSRNLDFDKLLELGARLELELNIPVDLVPLEGLPPSFKLRIPGEGVVVVEKLGFYEYPYKRSYDELLQLSRVNLESKQPPTEIPSSAFMGSRYEGYNMLGGARSKPHGVSSPPRVSGLDDVILRLRERCRALEEVFGDELVGPCYSCSGASPA
jgi:predicted nucleotidyltransferase